MMDRETIAAELAKDLDKAHVKPPPPGKYGEYIEGWHAIAEASRIFGWDGWSYRVDRLEQTNRDPDQGRNSDQWANGYLAIVTVTAAGDDGPSTTAQDVGHGQGYSKSEGDAHDSAMKEAVTDALKRALRTFGHPFGLALYDKTKAHVSDNPDYDPKADTDRLLDALKHTADCDLGNWSKTNEDALKRLRARARPEYDRVSAECIRRSNVKQQEHA